MNCSSIPDYTHTLDLVVALGGIPGAFFSSRFPTIIPIIIINPLNSKEMNNKKKKTRVGPTFSYYGLYLLDYLTTNKFEQAADEAFIRERTDRAAEAYERARLEGYPADGAQELAMKVLTEGLRYSKHAILREVVENEFAGEVPGEKNVKPLPRSCYRLSETYSPSMTSRTTISPCRPNMTCSTRS